MDRSAIMRAIKGKNTAPELLVRKLLRSFAPGYRLHRRDVPGRPDIAYVGRKRAVFVHGCFWHGHDCARGGRVPKTNTEFWAAKIARNRARDAAVLKQLKKGGWRALVVWECELGRLDKVERRLRRFVKRP